MRGASCQLALNIKILKMLHHSSTHFPVSARSGSPPQCSTFLVKSLTIFKYPCDGFVSSESIELPK